VGDSDSILTIAGEGHVVSRDISRIQHLDRWLSDSEVLSLITNSDVVVLPYLEASQSGIIPVALSSNRPIVITPVGGLIEQIEDGINGVVSKGITPQALAAALNKATTQEFFFKSEVEFLQSSSELLKLCRR
jgi:glycosyltransferase involved in cell wall biosynthesis